MDLQLKGKVFVVGGGEGDVGRAIGETLHSEGATVVSLDIKTTADLSNPEDVKTVFGELRAFYPKIDGYISAVLGGTVTTRPLDVTPDEMEMTLRHTLLAAVYPIQEATRWMVETGGGTVVVIGTINAKLGLGEFAYDVAKGAVHRIAPDIATLYADRGIRALTLCPGTIYPGHWWTGFEDALEGVKANIPDHKPTTPKEVGAAVAFLMSPYGAMFNGSEIYADRGWSLRPPFTKV
jgi:NAD(P)-dependent dehydrogenase (short-subunit alcohol dehydrogenase family)